MENPEISRRLSRRQFLLGSGILTADQPGSWQIAAQVEGAEPMVRAILKYRESSASPPLANEKPAELGGRLLTMGMLKAAEGLLPRFVSNLSIRV